MIKHIESEEALIASLLYDYHGAISKADGLSLEIFTKKDHRLIFASMVTLAEDKKPIDIVSVANDSKLSVSDIMDIQDRNIEGISLVPYHCDIVVNDWKKNQMSLVLKKADLSIDDQTVTSELVDSVAYRLQEIDTVTSSDDMLISEVFDVMMDGIIERFDKKVPSGLRTGYSFIDSFTNGYKPGNLIIIGARPGVGKTTFALDQAVSMARSGEPMGFLTMEMNPEELMFKIVGIQTGIDTFLLESGNISDQDLNKVASAKEAISKLPLIVKDPMSEDPVKIINQIKVLHSKYGIKAVFVDYLQLMGSDRKQENRNQELSKITRSLKRLAQDLHIPIIVLSQLNRPPRNYTKNREKADDFVPPPRPTLTALKDSGSIEQDANVVIFLHNKEPDEVLIPSIEVIIAKNRGGQLGATKMLFNKKQSKFNEEDPFHE